MKKVALSALLAGAAALPAAAQTNVTLCGVLDVNVESVNHLTTGTGSGSALRLTSDGLFGSRWGIRGSEDLGSGNKALFVLESGIKVDTGASSVADKLFSRLSFVGLESSTLGRLTAGRQYTAMFDIINPYFPLTRAPQYEPYAAIESIYTDNAIKYAKTAGALKFATHYGFGETAGSIRAGANYSAGVSYEPGPFSASLSYDQTNTAANTAGSFGYYRRAALAGKYVIDKTTLSGGVRYGKQIAQNGSQSQQDNLWWIGAGHDFTPVINGAIGYYYQDIKQSTTFTKGNPQQVGARVTYALSKRTDLYGVAAYVKNAALNFTAPTLLGSGDTNQTGLAFGVRHQF